MVRTILGPILPALKTEEATGQTAMQLAMSLALKKQGSTLVEPGEAKQPITEKPTQ
jgi:hypothetical protein